MNIHISLPLFKRQGLTSAQVDNIREALQSDVKKLHSDVQKAHSDVDFWKRQLRKQAPTKTCTKCKGKIDLWPFNQTAYYIKNNRVAHQTCPKKVTK